jgi:preprotein translocase subunit YajC
MMASKANERKKFTDYFGVGDEVAIIRTNHGWFDGSLLGLITEVEDYYCKVKTGSGDSYEIKKTRDLLLIEKAKKAKR